MKKLIAIMMFMASPSWAGEWVYEIEGGPGVSNSDNAFINFKAGNKHFKGFLSHWQGSRENTAIGIEASFVARDEWLYMGTGLAYLQNKNEHICTHLNFTLSFGVQINEQWRIGWRHFSNGDVILGVAGNCWGREDKKYGENLGEDFLYLSYTF